MLLAKMMSVEQRFFTQLSLDSEDGSVSIGGGGGGGGHSSGANTAGRHPSNKDSVGTIVRKKRQPMGKVALMRVIVSLFARCAFFV